MSGKKTQQSKNKQAQNRTRRRRRWEKCINKNIKKNVCSDSGSAEPPKAGIHLMDCKRCGKIFASIFLLYKLVSVPSTRPYKTIIYLSSYIPHFHSHFSFSFLIWITCALCSSRKRLAHRDFMCQIHIVAFNKACNWTATNDLLRTNFYLRRK